MQLHELKPKSTRARSRRVGRGGVRGKTSGRGTKGQKARAGHRIRPEIRDFIKKLPKQRGRGKNINKAFREKATPVNLAGLEKAFKAGEMVDPKSLIERKLIRNRGEKTPRVKILGHGDLSKKLTVSGCEVSAKAKEAIEKAGGSIA